MSVRIKVTTPTGDTLTLHLWWTVTTDHSIHFSPDETHARTLAHHDGGTVAPCWVTHTPLPSAPPTSYLDPDNTSPEWDVAGMTITVDEGGATPTVQLNGQPITHYIDDLTNALNAARAYLHGTTAP